MQKRPFRIFGFRLPEDSGDVYEAMFPETAAELWGKDNLRVGDRTIVRVELVGSYKPMSLEITRDDQRVWVSRVDWNAALGAPQPDTKVEDLEKP